jgi:hypothetical protein
MNSYDYYGDKVFPEEVNDIKNFMRDTFSTNLNGYADINSRNDGIQADSINMNNDFANLGTDNNQFTNQAADNQITNMNQMTQSSPNNTAQTMISPTIQMNTNQASQTVNSSTTSANTPQQENQPMATVSPQNQPQQADNNGQHNFKNLRRVY